MNAPLPEGLSTKEKQQKAAERVVARYRNGKTITSKLVQLQGTSSITAEVAIEGEPSIIIQFRTVPLDITPFIVAKGLIGAVVPDIDIIQDDILSSENISCVWMSRVQGEPWLILEDILKEEAFLNAAETLGRVLSGCFVPGEEDSIKSYIVPLLKNILTVKSRFGADISAYFPLVEKLITLSDRLSSLPKFFSHVDLNPMNIFLDQAGNITGLIDWEGALTLPFGLSAWAIHFLAGKFITLNDGGIGFVERQNFELMERTFWSALLDGAPEEIYDDLKGKMDLLQLAVITGTVLRVLGFSKSEHGENPGIHLPSLEVLPKLLTYRIPFLRDEAEKPFSMSTKSLELDVFLNSLL